jgi:hypothetical protein
MRYVARVSASSPSPHAGAAAGYRSAAVIARDSRVLAFDRLPPAVRERLARGLSAGAPDALLAAPSGFAPQAERALLGLGVIALGAVAGLFHHGIGALHGEGAVQPTSYAVAYGALLGLAGVALVAFFALKSLQQGAPFRSGRYLLALDLLEVEGGRLRLTSLSTLRALSPRPRQVAAVFEDGHVALFPAPKGDDPSTLAGDLTRTIRSTANLAAPADAAKLQRLDPFFEVRVSDDWEACLARQPRSRARLAIAAAAAVTLAAPLGFGLVHARNALSDDMMFDEARATPEPRYTDSLIAYAVKGHRHTDEALYLIVDGAHGDRVKLRRYAAQGGVIGTVAEDALFEIAKTEPDELAGFVKRGGRRAEEADEELFAIARRFDTADGYAAYAAVGKKHLDEVKRELLPEAEFRQASQSPQVGALCMFVRRNPGSPHEDEAWKRIRDAYAAAMPAFEAAEHPPPEGARFARALLDTLLERADPRITLDVRTADTEALAAADKTKASEHGDLYLPGASRFSPGRLAPLRGEIRRALHEWFGKAFPRGVVEVASPSTDDEGRPRLAVTLEPVLDGIAEWAKPGEDAVRTRVTPLVGFSVQIVGTVVRDNKTITLFWKMHLSDDSENGKMLTRVNGKQRGRGEMLDDVYAPFLDAVPGRIATSFRERF